MLKVDLNKEKSLVILEPNGKLCKEDFINASNIIDPFILENEKLNGLIIYVKSFPSWDSFSSLIEHLKFVNNHHKKISHVAFVTNSLLGDFAQSFMDYFISAEIKTFSYEKLQNAKDWITSPNLEKHGLTLGIQRIDNEFILTLKVSGKLTHDDYEKITPLINSSLEGITNPKLNVLADITELDGWEVQAAWDDLKLGLKYGSDFGKIAIYGRSTLIVYGAKIASWFLSGEIKQFDDMNKAIAWINKK
tara:strand:+ start:670 stop:1413 length:744 start_codon:yes stop_codon:yes gene_type:complete